MIVKGMPGFLQRFVKLLRRLVVQMVHLPTMKKVYFFLLLAFFCVKALCQIPSNWPVINNQLTAKLNGVLHKVDSMWDGKPYCTSYAGNLLLANSNEGYKLFTATPAPNSVADTNYEKGVLAKVDSLLLRYHSMGYRAVDITINYPVLVDSFPHGKDYLHFFQKVYGLAHALGFKITEGCQATFADTLFGEANMTADINTFYFNPNGTHDTLNTARFIRTKTQMMQTIIDSLAPDYLTTEMEPTTQQVNLYNLVSYKPDSMALYVNYYLNHLVKHHTLVGAGSGSWDTIAYIQKLAATGMDYIDYHVYPLNNNFIDNHVFLIDSIAHATGKKIIIGEAWDNKISDSEYNGLTPLAAANLAQSRDVFDYWEPLDTLFQHTLVHLARQAKIDVVNFFYSNVMFGQLTYGPSYASLTAKQQFTLGEQSEFSNMYHNIYGPEGTSITNAIAHVCDTNTAVKEISGAGNFDMTVYPNPTYGCFTLGFSAALPSGTVVTLSDISGRMIKEYYPATGATTLQVQAALAGGMYIVKIYSRGYASVAKKVVVN